MIVLFQIKECFGSMLKTILKFSKYYKFTDFLTNVLAGAFFAHRFYVCTCGCGEVFGFKVVDALEYLGKNSKSLENMLRNHIRAHVLGYNGVRIHVGKGQPKGSHIQRKKMADGLYKNETKGKIFHWYVDDIMQPSLLIFTSQYSCW